MRILITGANGFLGHYLCEQLLEKNHVVIATGKSTCRLPFAGREGFIYRTMDFTDPFEVNDVFMEEKPEVVIHAGALSKPDDCEADQWQAWKTNVEGTVIVLTNAEEHHCFFIFLSTDFIFDGERGMYSEQDFPNPVNYYGKTKLEAEEAVRELASHYAIVRTVLVYGKPTGGRGNLLSVVRDKLQQGESYAVFNDQVRTPTYVEDLAAAIITVIEKKATGTWHISGETILTPYEMAIQAAERLGFNQDLIKKITSSDLVQAAKRPLKTGFIIEKARNELGFQPRPFSEGLDKTFS